MVAFLCAKRNNRTSFGEGGYFFLLSTYMTIIRARLMILAITSVKGGVVMGVPFKHSAGFGKRIEYNIIGKMLMEGLECYVPLVDDHGVDCIVKKQDGTFIEIQIKARSNEVKDGDAALFAGITHELRENFYFVFYSERLDTMWILSSEEFLKECSTNKAGKNTGKRTIWFNGNKLDQNRKKQEYCKPQFKKYICHNFSRFY